LQAIPKVRHWRSVRYPPALPAHALHLWKIHTGRQGTPLARLWSLLSPRESQRAARFRFDHHRERYVRAHGGLREILSPYVGIEPQAIRLEYTGAGKPLLGGTVPRLDFNLTTSGDLALVAVSSGEPIGVDCERIRDRRNLVAIATRMLTSEEASRIAATAKGEQLERFHLAWTALEAEVKADGRGLVARGRPTAHGALEIKHCVPAPGFVAAVARKDLPPVREWVTLELATG
jgi:4'-phosphopantetheinyl transferase